MPLHAVDLENTHEVVVPYMVGTATWKQAR